MGKLILDISLSILLLSGSVVILCYAYACYREAEYNAMESEKLKKELEERFKLHFKPEE